MASLCTSSPRLWATGSLSRPVRRGAPLFRRATAASVPLSATAIPTCLARSSSNAAEAVPNFADILSRPTWSVKSLLSPETETETPPDAAAAAAASDATAITRTQLHHLFRLSALPAPAAGEDEAETVRTLRAQLRFVRDVQAVDTAGVAPLRSIRDETAAGRREQAIGLEQLGGELELERPFGRSGRPRRRTAQVAAATHEPWDVLQTAPRRAGNYFIVKSR
ncbi:hypothetical protein GGTG_04259 [Gaeumannomyces tritici R3-111a-1]|uniref:Glutamyl-tRNA amidotransferase complex subunit Gta3 domain-containing protein n=1 Tax=Gaeumannomyces tritici (strain R3-111a-1) TaxID=644352 RepID=J3NSK8_GAET3|nr:hypothetical protein GGTG_04259 [Gaeumannomyces tritici R3-111a-1]EJT79171.1 hypothetical protein GGTG_04259 [Gaeumannomyces tritici R3-111a-1]